MAATFVVEDGTKKTDANALCTVAFVDQYLENNGNPAAWSSIATEADKQAHIRLATRYIEAVYGNRLPGYRASATQRLSFPISGAIYIDGYAIDDESVPREVQEACAIASLKSAEGTLLHGTRTSPSRLSSKKVKIDVITIEKTWLTGESTLPRFDDLNGVLRRILTPATEVERA